MAQRSNGVTTNDPRRAKPSTVFVPGQFLQKDGLGHVEPLQPGGYPEVLCLEAVQATDPNFAAANKRIACDAITEDTDRFYMPVGVGTATSAMELQIFDVDPSDAGALDVTAPGTQFKVWKFINSGLVEVGRNTDAITVS